jgi:hypothetical protein
LTGTVFHRSKVPLRTWLFVLFEMCANKNGMAARDIERKYGVAPKTAWFMAHRIREAMKRDAPGGLVGTIVSDETWVIGEPRNRHHHRAGVSKRRSGIDKTPAVALINAETGEACSAVLPNVDSTTLRKAMVKQELTWPTVCCGRTKPVTAPTWGDSSCLMKLSTTVRMST